MHIRKVQPDDISQLVTLCELHAAYEKADFDPSGKAEKLSKAIFSSDPQVFCWVIVKDKVLYGYLSATHEFSTWDADFFMHMDCLYLKPETRGKGFGYQLILVLKAFARAKGCPLIQWQTPVDNESGIAFYEKLAAQWKAKRRYYLSV